MEMSLQLVPTKEKGKLNTFVTASTVAVSYYDSTNQTVSATVPSVRKSVEEGEIFHYPSRFF